MFPGITRGWLLHSTASFSARRRQLDISDLDGLLEDELKRVISAPRYLILVDPRSWFDDALLVSTQLGVASDFILHSAQVRPDTVAKEVAA
jgi:hypothetical protein